MSDTSGYINITPTWRGVLPALLLVLEQGTEEGRKVALQELHRMAEAADRHVDAGGEE